MTLDFQDWDYRVLCPLLPGERALFGDVARYATMGDRRIGGVAASVASLSFDVIGMPGTAVADARLRRRSRRTACAPQPTAANASSRATSSVTTRPAAGSCNVGLDQSGTARVTLDW